MEIIFKKVKDLIPYVNNSRTHSEEQVNQICASINEFGFTNPLLIDEKGSIIAGHGRLMASKKLGMEEVPCIVLKGLTEAQKKAYIIADNKMALNAGWDEKLLKIELENLKELDFDLELTGFNVDELDDILGKNEEEVEIIEDDYEVEVPEEPKAKLGDIYQLGNHRLMCGDSTSIDDVEKLMNGNKADVVYTDPPYGMFLDTDYSKFPKDEETMKKMGIKRSGIKYDKVIGDNDDFKDELVTTIFDNFNYCKEMFIWGADYYPELLKDYKNGNYIVWDKKKNDGLESNLDNTFTSTFEICWSKKKHKKDIVRILWCGILGTEQEHDHKRVHPTQKPTKLAKWFLEKYSDENDNVVDLYGGSGSTLIACEQLSRKCYMMELDPHYIDVIIQRWENFTGEKAVLLNREEEE